MLPTTDDFLNSRRGFLRAGLGLVATLTAPRLLAGASNNAFFAGYDLPIGLQLYMLGDAVASDLEGSLARVAAIGYRTIELAGIRPQDAVRTRAAADKAGLTISSVHVGLNLKLAGEQLSLSGDSTKVVDVLKVLGCRDVVVPFPRLPDIKLEGGEDIATTLRRAFSGSADPWKRTAAALNESGASLKRAGLSLSYHNHSLEFMSLGDTCGWDILAAETDPEMVSFEVDVGWVVAGRRDPVAFLNGLAGRVRHLHVKDLRAPTGTGISLTMVSTEVGSGIVDWKHVLSAAYRAGARQFFVEQEPPFQIDRFEAAAKSYSYLKRL